MVDTGQFGRIGPRMSQDRIPIIVPDLKFDEVELDLRAVFESGQLTAGPFVEKFEQAVAEWVGVSEAVATTSATTALHLALEALDVGVGDEVLMSDFTFPATANAVIQTGATPVFVDSGVSDFAMDANQARELATERTRVIMPVDPFGQPADHEKISAVAGDVGAKVIVDAACSLGGERFGLACGSHGDMGCFSFHPRKVVTSGEGGMITTSDATLANRLRSLRNHGAVRTERAGLSFIEPGYNYRLSEVAAVMGLNQVRRLDEILLDRRLTASRYDEKLANISGLFVPRPAKSVSWSYQSYVVVMDDGVDRNSVIRRMAEHHVETTIGTYACHQHPAYENLGYSSGDLPNSDRFARQALTLPLIPRMPEQMIDRVVEALISVLDSE